MITKNPKTILIADNSTFFMTKVSDTLVNAGHRTRYVFDGREAINILQKSSYDIDLLILDLDMPNVDGFGVLEWLKENACQRKFPVLAVTEVYEISKVIDRVKELGATGIITREFTPEQIAYRINRFLFPEKKENKVATRVPISTRAKVFVRSSTYSGSLGNISSTGVFLNIGDELVLGSLVRIKFTLPGTDRLFDLEGVVKWSTESNEKKNYFRGSGIMFTNMSPEDNEALNNFIASEARKLGIEE